MSHPLTIPFSLWPSIPIKPSISDTVTHVVSTQRTQLNADSDVTFIATAHEDPIQLWVWKLTQFHSGNPSVTNYEVWSLRIISSYDKVHPLDVVDIKVFS